MRGRKSDQARLGGISPLDCLVYARVAEEEEMHFAIIKPVIHTGGLENGENSTACFFFYHKVISGTDFAAQHYYVASSRQSFNAGYSGL